MASDQPVKDKAAYRVEVERGGCEHCGARKEWAVVGPDDVGESTTFENIDDAEAYADSLNAAYDHGLEAAAKIADAMARNPWGAPHEAITPEHLAQQIAAAIRQRIQPVEEKEGAPV